MKIVFFMHLRWVEKGCIGKRYKENEGSLREIQFS